MRNQMQMPGSLAEIRVIETSATVRRKKIYTDSLILLVASKIELASKSGDVTKLTLSKMKCVSSFWPLTMH